MKKTLRVLVLISAVVVSINARAAQVSQPSLRTEGSQVSILLKLKDWILGRTAAPKAGSAKVQKPGRRAMDCINGHDQPPGYGCPGY